MSNSTPPNPPPPTPPVAPQSTANPTPSPTPSTTAGTTKPNPPNPKTLEPLTGFRSALEHTGLPRSVLLYKPKLPSRNWLIFWTVLSSVSYIYYDDRRKCKKIKQEYIDKVKHLGQEPIQGGSLGLVRKVKVLAARWPEDDEADRGQKYFRKYLKPYLVAAGIDYETMPPPLYGAITRQTHASILTKRRQKLGLEPTPVPLSVPGALDPSVVEQNELEGGIVLIGRPSLKEYLEGLKRGWSDSVDEWNWEKEVSEKLKNDGVFENPPQETGSLMDDQTAESGSTITKTNSTASSPLTGLSFLNRPQIQQPQNPSTTNPTSPQIPSHMHIAPNPLPPQPPLLLVPWTNHLGFQQIPYMIYDFFTEHKKVESGAKLAYALICGHTRPFIGTNTSSSPFSLDTPTSNSSLSSSSSSETDLDFDRQAERYIKNDFDDLPAKLEKAKKDYYLELSTRLQDIRSLANGERELSDIEKKSTKPLPTEQDLKDERFKKELRWRGQVEGWGITRKEQDVTWQDDGKWDGWLKVFRSPDQNEELQGKVMGQGMKESLWGDGDK